MADSPEPIATRDRGSAQNPPAPPSESASEKARRKEAESEEKVMTAFSQAFTRALQTTRDEGVAKLRTPDPFDGQDPQKYRTFVTQCEVYFRANPARFRNDEKKVNFAFTYLTETALEWFELKFAEAKTSPAKKPSRTKVRFGESASQAGVDLGNDSDDENEVDNFLTAPIGPSDEWKYSWDTFIEELRTNFGPADDEGDAERRLMNLHMPSDKRIAWYNLRFLRYQIRTSWDDRALTFRYYDGLPERLQDNITSDGKPRTLSEMRKLAIKWDQRYWERQGEKKKSAEREKKAPKPASAQSTTTTTSPSASSNHRNSNDSKAQSSSSKKSSTSSTPKPNDLGDKLGKDGKLTPAERTRRIANNLCLFCGLAGHRAADCKKAMKARAATAEKAPAAASTSASAPGKA